MRCPDGERPGFAIRSIRCRAKQPSSIPPDPRKISTGTILKTAGTRAQTSRCAEQASVMSGRSGTSFARTILDHAGAGLAGGRDVPQLFLNRRFASVGMLGRSLAAALVTAGLFMLTPAPRAQGTLIAPGGQSRVTAPGGLRGRAALRHRAIRHRAPRHKRHR